MLAWIHFRVCLNQIFSRGFIFADGQISAILRGFYEFSRSAKFLFEKFVFSCLCLNKQKTTKRSRHENCIYFSTVYLQQMLCL